MHRIGIRYLMTCKELEYKIFDKTCTECEYKTYDNTCTECDIYYLIYIRYLMTYTLLEWDIW